MVKRLFTGLTFFVLALIMSLPALAQESAVKGSVEGVVVDASGGAVPGSKVTLEGPEGSKSSFTDDQGNYMFPLLIPGRYNVKVEKQGFKLVSVTGIEVLTNKVSSVRTVLETGTVNETVEVTGSTITVDTTTTAIGANLNDTFYEKIPIPRGVAGLFYLAPGVTSGGAAGKSNPSISGGSGLENQYVADGVDITDSAFGGLGIFSRSYGSLGTGINLTFIKEVEVKTGGYEPQYGKSTGGIVQIVTKSGGNAYHGAISAYFAPQALEATHTNPDDPQFGVVNLTGRLLHNESYDAAAELGGYVPHFKDHLFFYAAINPTLNDQFADYPVNSPLFANGTQTFRTYTYSYDAKLTWKINDRNQIESSVFGDPSHTSDSPWVRLTTFSQTANSKLNFGNRDWDVRYNGTLSPTWLLNISGAWGYNHFDETGFPSEHEIIDQTQTELGTGAQFVAAGRGFVEPTEDNTFKINIDTSKTVHHWGEQTFSVGFGWEKSFYKGGRQYSGGTDPIPGTNMDGTPLSIDPTIVGSLANSEFYLREDPNCTACPLMDVSGQEVPVYLRLLRSEFGVQPDGIKSFSTSAVYKSAFVNDSWSINKFITLSLGARWDQNHLIGQVSKYTFVDNWSPRLGFAIDPKGDRKNKIYGNFARYNYNLPLDLAERSLTNEFDLSSFRLAPAYTTVGGVKTVTLNQFNTVTPIFDAAHVLNGVVGGEGPLGIGSSSQSTEAIAPGTRDMYEDEWVAGYEHEFAGGIVFTAKYVRRDLKRIVEDTGGISPEASDVGIPQTFLIANVSANTDLFTNPIPTDFIAATDPTGAVTNYPTGCNAGNTLFPVTNSLGQGVTDGSGNTAACFTAAQNANAGAPVPDGKPDGFTNAIRRYTAVEFEVNKSFSHNFQLRANYRIARLDGNYEGALRNDNGQTDPGISSLFDFTPGNFGLLGGQFIPGPLPTDRLHIANGFFTYVFDRGFMKSLALGTGVRIQTGIPLSELAAHPVYLNAGEVPIGGRGSEGRTPTVGSVDFHGEYPIRLTEWARLHVGVDLFNIGFAKRALFINQNIDLGFGTPNADFLKPNNQTTVLNNDAFQQPFQARLFVKFEF
jgi:Carboxypeptidase regulatory-like domain/TonB-dependent Receptor Plug Domain